MKVRMHSIIFFFLFWPLFLSATSCVPSHLELEQKKEVSNEPDSNSDGFRELPKIKSLVELPEPVLLEVQESSKPKVEEFRGSKSGPLIESKKTIEPIAGSINLKKTEIQKRTIVVHNKITPKMSSYIHWGTSHTPTFTIRSHGKVIVPDVQDTLEVIDNSLKIEYHADFYGMRTSNDSADFILKPETKEVEITFSWDAKPRIIITEI